MKTNIFKLGNSNAIRIPKSFMETLNLKCNDEINLNLEKDKIIIQKATKRKNIDELFENYNCKYEYENLIDDAPIGKELL